MILMEFPITITFNVSPMFLADVLVSAIEGGIGYWSQTLVYKWEDLQPVDFHATILVPDDADPDNDPHQYVITPRKLLEGIQRVLAPGFQVNPQIRNAILQSVREDDAGNIDADAADVIVQAALFSEIVYG